MLPHEWAEASEQVVGTRLSLYYEAAAAIYRLDRFDSVLTGPDRHQKLAQWVNEHQRLFLRFQRARVNRIARKQQSLRQAIYTLQGEIARLEAMK